MEKQDALGKLRNANHEQNLPAMRVFMDNMSAIAQAENVEIKNAARHIQVRYHWLKEAVSNGSIKMLYVPTGVNNADLHTKNFTERKTDEHRRLSGMMTEQEFVLSGSEGLMLSSATKRDVRMQDSQMIAEQQAEDMLVCIMEEL